MQFYLFEMEFGWVCITGTVGQIAHLVLPVSTRAQAYEGVAGLGFVETACDFSGEAERIAAYFSGRPVEFSCRVETAGFDGLVWNAARSIPYGETRSYGWIADRIGKPGAARAVGQALGRNPVPVIVPCHRVLRADGTLGGFSSGLDWKRKLLSLETGGV
ncbi:MAG: methylated-DNA--[protein]-cysteine S-methyltransferase [Armatimonadota bacterium]